MNKEFYALSSKCPRCSWKTLTMTNHLVPICIFCKSEMKMKIIKLKKGDK